MPATSALPSTPQNQSITYSVPDDSDYDSESDNSVASVSFVKRQARVFSVPSSGNESDDSDSLEEISPASSNKTDVNGDHTDTVSSPPPASEPSSPVSKSPALAEESDEVRSTASDAAECSSQFSESTEHYNSDDDVPEVLPINKETDAFSSGKATGKFDLECDREGEGLRNGMGVFPVESNKASEKVNNNSIEAGDALKQSASTVGSASRLGDTLNGTGGGSSFTLQDTWNATVGETATSVTPMTDLPASEIAAPEPYRRPDGMGIFPMISSCRQAMTEAVQQPPPNEAPPRPRPKVEIRRGQPTPLPHQPNRQIRSRSPSPSDAALAKNAAKLSTQAEHDRWPNDTNGFWNEPNHYDFNAYHYEPFQHTGGLGGWQPPPPRPRLGHMDDYGDGNAFGYALAEHRMHDCSNVAQHYLDGPFSSVGLHSDYSIVSDSSSSKVPERLDLSTMTESTPFKVPKKSSYPGMTDAPPPTKEKANETNREAAQASKLDISNLVHSPLPTSSVSTLKRKADAITQDEPAAEAVGAPLRTVESSAYNDGTEEEEQGRALSPELLPAIPEAASGMTEAEVLTSESNLIPEEAVERPPKRLKATAIHATGLAKFALGVGVGALGVVGAFVASIPASVREEAWQEFQKAQ